MARLYNYDAEKAVEVPDSDVQKLIGEGSHSFLRGQKVHVFDPAGQIYNLPAESAGKAFGQGYRYANKKEVEYEKLKSVVDSSPGTTVLLGFLRSMSFGLSDAALIKAGVPDEVLIAHKEQSPVWNMGGELGGLVNPKGPIQWATGALTKTALKVASPTSKIATRLIEGSIDGAVSTVPSAVSGYILDPEDAPAFGEQVLAGAAFGAGFGGVVSLVSKASEKSGKSLMSFANREFLKATGAKTPEYNIISKKGKQLDRIESVGKRLGELYDQKKITDISDHETLQKEIADLLPEVGSDLGEIIKQVSKMQKEYASELGDVSFNPAKIAERMRAEILTGALDPKSAVPKELKTKIKKIESIINDLGENLKPGNFEALEMVKRQYQALAKERGAYMGRGSSDILAGAYGNMARILKEEAETSLIQLEEKLGTFAYPDKSGTFIPQSLFDDFKKTKAMYGDLADLNEVMPRIVVREAGQNSIPLTGWIFGSGVGAGLASSADSLVTAGLMTTVGTIGGMAVRKFAKDKGDFLAARAMRWMSGRKELVDAAGTASKKTSNVIRGLVRGSSKLATDQVFKSEDDMHRDFKEVRKGLGKLSNLEIRQNNINSLFEGMPESEPEIQTAMMTTIVNAVDHLITKLPKNQVAFADIIPDMDALPDNNSIRKFMDTVGIVNNPISALEHVAAGTITSDQVETLIEVYPKLYASQVQLVLAGLAESGTSNLSLQQKIALSKFTKRPMTPVLANVEKLQAMLQAKEEPMKKSGRVIRPGGYETSTQSAQTV